MATWNAFRTYEPDASFISACAQLQVGADNLAARLAKLSKEATVLAEVATLSGDCEYLQ